MRVVRLVDEADWKSLWPVVENIFFATSRIQIFADEQARNSFKARWLDRYLNHYIDSFFIARSDDGWLIGYLAGCLENPMLNPLFNDLGYYKAFAPFCASYLCHLHINIAADCRNHGIGDALIEASASFDCPSARNAHRHERGGAQYSLLRAQQLSHSFDDLFERCAGCFHGAATEPKLIADGMIQALAIVRGPLDNF
jgi:hypothetical protein